jgi:hypothetical protein
MEVAVEIMVNDLFARAANKVFDGDQNQQNLIAELMVLNDRIDCLQRSVANLRGDLAQIIHAETFHTIDQRNGRVSNLKSSKEKLKSIGYNYYDKELMKIWKVHNAMQTKEEGK